MKTPLSDEETIRLLHHDQPVQCFDTLYQRYVNKVYRRCLSMTKDAEEAQDYTQDIFLKVFRNLSAFQARSSFSTWLYSIAYNHCADQLKRTKRLVVVPLDESRKFNEADLPEDSLQDEALQLVNQVLAMLPEAERTMLLLKYEDGLTIEELAQLYQLNPSTVKMRLMRSRKKIQQLCARL